jgi:hypothetical protein
MFIVHSSDLDPAEDIGIVNLLLFTVIDETVPYFKGAFVYILH